MDVAGVKLLSYPILIWPYWRLFEINLEYETNFGAEMNALLYILARAKVYFIFLVVSY